MEFEPASYRDRWGRVYYHQGQVHRALSTRALDEWRALRATALLRDGMAQGTIVRTSEAELPAEAAAAGWVAALRHETIPFISYPYEWCFGMLRQAALLQLDLLEKALAEGFTLRDASSYNVQWRGGRPVFIDIPSFSRWRAGEPWMGYRQFCETALYPLLLSVHRGIPFQPWLRGRLDGIAPEQARRLFSWRDWVRPGVFTHVVLHALSDRRFAAHQAQEWRGELAAVGFRRELVLRNVRGLAALLRRLTPPAPTSAWSTYERDHSYSAPDRAAKEEFVVQALGARRYRMVWDLGANTGFFARLATRHADWVVALDADPAAVEVLHADNARAGCKNLLPLVVDLADPSPAQGWRGRERKDLPSRGRPDLVLCLALVHHLVLGANLRVADVVDWLAELADLLVIEFVRREDPMVQLLLGRKDESFADYDLAPFEAALAERFEVLRREPLPSARRLLYLARARRAA